MKFQQNIFSQLKQRKKKIDQRSTFYMFYIDIIDAIFVNQTTQHFCKPPFHIVLLHFCSNEYIFQ